MADTKEMNPTDRTRLYDAVRTARSTTATREEKRRAAEVQGEMKKKYPDIYGKTRLELFNQVEAGNKEMNKGGMAKKKVQMMMGGMANGKKHMYAAGGDVKDNAGLRALKKASPEAYNKIKGI